MEYRKQSSVVPEAPDEQQIRFSRKTWAAVILASLTACWFVQETFPSMVAIVPHAAWLLFHLLYGGTLAMVYMKQRNYTSGFDPEAA